ncbi:hypothetical protein D3C72_2228100 [compost metagenome]
MRCLRTLDALKVITRRGEIGTSSPVFGLRPIRSFLLRTWKVAKEESLTISPRTMALQISSITVSTSSADSVRERPTLRNTDSAKSARVTVLPAMVLVRLNQ